MDITDYRCKDGGTGFLVINRHTSYVCLGAGELLGGREGFLDIAFALRDFLSGKRTGSTIPVSLGEMISCLGFGHLVIWPWGLGIGNWG